MTIWTIPTATSTFRKAAEEEREQIPPLALPIFVAIHADEEVIEQRLGLWKRRLDSFFQLGPGHRSVVSRSPGLAMISIQPARRIFDVPLVHADETDHVASAHYLAEETPDEAWRNDGRYLKRAFQADNHVVGRFWRIPPPAAVGAHSLRTGTIRLFDDFLGSGRIYYRLDTGIEIFSTGLAAIPLVLGVLPATDDRTWQLFSAFD